VQAVWTEASAAREETVSVTGVSLPLPAAETAAPSAAPRVGRVEVPPDPAAAEALPALAAVAEVGLAAVAVAVVVVEGGK
jgi:hypothetical protein